MNGSQIEATTRGTQNKVYYQLGAPALIYYSDDSEGISSPFSSGWNRNARALSSTINDTLQRRSRVRARWFHDVDLHKIKEVALPNKIRKRKKKYNKSHSAGDSSGVAADTIHNQNESYEIRKRGRLGMLLQDDLDFDAHRILFEKYEALESPYLSARKDSDRHQGYTVPSHIEWNPSQIREFCLDRQQSSDPSYLAPFGLKSLYACQDQDKEAAIKNRSNSQHLTFRPPQTPQGNCLLSFPCPCPSCTNRQGREQSWCLIHPIGDLLDHICVSNLIFPNGTENSGHVYSSQGWERVTRKKDMIQSIVRHLPNSLCLDDTILEIKQGGTWHGENPVCTFLVRTTTHVSILCISVKKPFFQGLDEDLGFQDGICWGNYVIEETKRINTRTFSRNHPSYFPISIACHLKYGNMFTNAMFAFVSHSDRGEYNYIHHGTAGAEKDPDLRCISNLKYISIIDFSTTQPMCLWSAATSHVRPGLAKDIQFKQPSLGFGTSLYSIDLRTNAACFQWSPSANEMVTEGVHSISSIMNDWETDNLVWVSSFSAGKAWEIDSRMPCRTVKTWSLTSSCEESAIKFTHHGLYGAGTLLAKTQQYENGCWTNSFPVLGVNVASDAFGIHFYQRADTQPRFHTDSLECISTWGLEPLEKAGVTTSSVFAMLDDFTEAHPCGLSTFCVKGSEFINDTHTAPFLADDSNILCSLVMISNGDLLCYSFVESNKDIESCRSHPRLPVGSRIIPIPKGLDGTTKVLEHKRWKPTGGMNLKLFLTNQFPTPANLSHVESNNPKSNRTIVISNPVNKMGEKDSKRAFDPSDSVYKFHSNKSGITFHAKCDSEVRITGEDSVTVPLSLIEKSIKSQRFYKGKEISPREVVDKTTTAIRSDLSADIIENVSGFWDESDYSEDEGVDI